MLFAEGDASEVPLWVVVATVLFTTIVGPLLNQLWEWQRRVHQRKKDERELDTKSSEHAVLLEDKKEKGVAARMSKLLDTITEERAKDIARWAQERERLEVKIDRLEKENEECRTASAGQTVTIEWLKTETNRQNTEIAYLQTEIKTLKAGR